MAEYNRPLPAPTPETRHFWDGCREGEPVALVCRQLLFALVRVVGSCEVGELQLFSHACMQFVIAAVLGRDVRSSSWPQKMRMPTTAAAWYDFVKQSNLQKTN